MTAIISRPAFSVATALIEEASRIYDMDPWDLPRLGQQRAFFKPRFAVAWVLKEMGKTYPSNSNPYAGIRIARLLGYADHTTVLYAYRQAEKLRAADPKFKAITDQLLAFAQSYGPQVKVKAA